MSPLDKPQLPPAGEIFVDHAAHFVPDIDAAAAAFERLGFRATPFRQQSNAGPDGAPIPAGTGNRCVMLRRGYIELLARTADTLLSRQLERQIARYVGIHLIAFGTPDAAGERTRLEQAGFSPLPLIELRRPGIGGPASFAVARVPPDAMPEGRVQFCEHRTEATVWAPDWLDHPNGALALDEVLVAVANPDEAADRFGRFVGRTAVRVAAGHRLLAVDRGRLHLVDAARLAALLGSAPPVLPFVVGCGILVRDLAAVRRLVDAAGFAVSPAGAASLAVTVPPALGGTFFFKEDGGDPFR